MSRPVISVPMFEALMMQDTDECILWPLSKDSSGYGLMQGQRKVHREVFHRTHGYYPEVVMHTCDTPACCNPRHLVAGTKLTNNQDRAAKGRSAQRVDSRRKLTALECEAIRRRYSPERVGIRAPNGVCALAKDYGVDANVIYKVLRGYEGRPV